MAVFNLDNDLPRFRNPVLTIGTFDGVHLGHRAILREVVRHAAEAGGESILITFEPHPRKLLFPGEPLKLLTPLPRKIELIGATGIDHIAVVPFTEAFAQLSAADYISAFLVARFHPHSIVIGYDHHFGHDRKGDLKLLMDHAGPCGYAVHEIPAEMIADAAVSSTKIRRELEGGNVAAAAAMLGRPYTLGGTVMKGAQLGRTIGYPTANILPEDMQQLIPARGVYAVHITCGGQRYDAMLNIGMRPTVTEERTLHIEAHLFGFSGDLYEEQVEVSFVQWLREERKFPSLDALKERLGLDSEQAQDILRRSGARQGPISPA